MRLFAGVALPDEYQERLRDLAGRWRGRLASRTTWTRPGNWHVTLKFLGDAAEDALPGVRSALATVSFAPFVLCAGGAGFFPPKGSPRVFWVGLRRGAGELTRLAAGVQAALEPLGFAPEDRPYRPHLTLARVRRAEKDPWGELSREAAEMDWPACEVRAFTLWESELGASGPRYRGLADFGATSL